MNSDWVRNWLVSGMLFAMVALLPACGATRPLESSELRTVTPVHAVQLFDQRDNPLPGTLSQLPEDDVAEILVISGGGANGAYGAGVLKGWTQSGQRPNFDIVTGVSTGALIAVMAFLGPEYDDVLERLYTEQSNDDIFREKGKISGLLSDSFYDYTPLKTQIQQVVTKELLDRIGAEHRKGRRLYVASTNLDAGQLVVWDLGALAASDRHNRVLRSQKILRASAAVPGFFQPVYLKPRNGVEIRQAHVDGAVKAPLLLQGFMLEQPAKKRNVYVLLNSSTRRADAAKAVKPQVADISRKSITELIRGLTYKTLFQAYVTSRNAKAHFKMTSIPDSLPPAENELDFDPVRMRELHGIGVEAGRAVATWPLEPPRLAPLERVVATE